MKPDAFAGFPVRVGIPVAWGEMDAFGHVNNVVYFRYFESARIAFFGADGFLMDYAVVSHRRERVAAEGSGRIVSYDYENKCKAPLQQEPRERLARLESGD